MASVTRLPSKRGSFWFICCEKISVSRERTSVATRRNAACTLDIDGLAVKSCTVLAVMADGSSITTIEGLAPADGLHPIQAAFQEHHALQCGFCTPGMIMSVRQLLKQHPNPTEREIRHNLAGNICRCTGYHNIVGAVEALVAGAHRHD